MSSRTSASRSKPNIAQPPATSRWCNRALRPLTAAILRLEKYLKSNPIQPHELSLISNDTTNINKSRSNGRLPSRSTEGSDSESVGEDPTWVPGNTMCQRVKHKYSGRKGKIGGLAKNRSRLVISAPEPQELQPGEFTVATPLILGKNWRHSGHQNYDIAEAEPHNELPKPTVHLEPLRGSRKGPSVNIFADDKSIYRDSAYVSIIVGISNAFDAFLKITSIEETALCRRRVPSLLSMALNKTSEYILQEQRRLNVEGENDDDIDVADYFFTELERTYTSSNEGWKPLRRLVRKHGIRLVTETIRNRMIPQRLARFLVLRTLESNSNDAATALREAFLTITPAAAHPLSLDCIFFSNTFLGTFFLECYIKEMHDSTLFFRGLSQLITRGIVPVEWMATASMKSHIVDAIQSVVSEDEHSTASAMLIFAIVRASLGLNKPTQKQRYRRNGKVQARRRPGLHPSEESVSFQASIDGPMSEALNNTICSMLTVLCSAHIARFEGQPHTISPMWYIQTSLAATVKRFLITAKLPTKNYSGSQRMRIGYVLMTQYIFEYFEAQNFDEIWYSPSLLSSIENFICFTPDRKQLVAGFSALFLQFSRCLCRGRDGNEFDILKPMTTLFESIHLRRYPSFRAMLTKVTVEVALNFAEYTCLREHHTWATDIQEKAAGFDHGLELMTPSLSLTTASFRWEDGIGEWVARTPCVKRSVMSRSATVKCPHEKKQPVIDYVGSFTPSVDSDPTSGCPSDVSSSSGQFGSSTTSGSPSTAPTDTEEEKEVVEEDSDAQTGSACGLVGHNQTRQNRKRRLSDDSSGRKFKDTVKSRYCLRARNNRVDMPVAIAIAVEIRPVIPRKCPDIDIVIRTNEHDTCFQENQLKVSGARRTSAEYEDDIFITAPALSENFQHKRQRHSYPFGRELIQPARRRVSARLAAVRRATIPHLNPNCSSDDELSFL
ncbi:hypothetical protein LOZ53_005785 [Ophidiomyces ophidiicola]|nr:hypothetical protein LOZ53_005785 [Ophidiomyces ophidiicola]